jgi:general secretion pathway protein G
MRKFFPWLLGGLTLFLASCSSAPPIEDHEARDTFQKIEGLLAHASSARIKFRYEASLWSDSGGTYVDFGGSGLILLKQTNRAQIDVEVGSRFRDWDNAMELNRQFHLYSDGSRMVTADPEPKILRTPATLNEVLGVMTVGIGFPCSPYLVTAYTTSYFEDAAPLSLEDLLKSYGPSDFRKGRDDGDLKTLFYKFEDPILIGDRISQFCEAKIWYDPKSFCLRKKVIRRRVTLGNQEVVIEEFSETYTEYSLGIEISDDTFGLGGSGSRAVLAPPDLARRTWTAGVIQQICRALDRFRQDQGRYPERLDDLVTMPTDLTPASYPPGGYLKEVPRDAWDRPFLYRVPGMSGEPYAVISLGSDGIEGGKGDARDIGSHDVYRRK